jgi:3-isopropylmalate/(R)-2-methylmalate dehydratase small subunit
VAGKNFGCGSSREQAASCLTGWGLKVIARNFARIFLQNSINVGLYMVICPTIDADLGDEIEVAGSVVKNLTKGKEFPVVPLPKARQAIIDAGGLIPYTKKLITSGKR